MHFHQRADHVDQKGQQRNIGVECARDHVDSQDIVRTLNLSCLQTHILDMEHFAG